MSERYYTISAATSAIFNEVNTELTIGSLISRNVECVDSMDHSPTRAEYLLTDAEATIVGNDDRIKFINLSHARYPELFTIPQDDIITGTNDSFYSRYGSPVLNWQNWSGSTTLWPSVGTSQGRTSSQLIRCEQKRNPWIESSTDDKQYIQRDPQAKGAGEHVDIIVADNGTWIGHPEFINPFRVTVGSVTQPTTDLSISPQDYTGGNVLPGNGYCDVLDVVLDGPYYIDPNWFNADPTNRLMTRWDGTTVPKEQEARNWWSNAANRSSAFASAGTVTINSSYTRDSSHGSNTTYPSSGGNGTHGTQCGSLTYGRNHGWAYNANKWQINILGSNNPGSYERSFDIQKIFHQNKPINPIYGTKDPTVNSNSWGIRSFDDHLTLSDGSYYFPGDVGSLAKSDATHHYFQSSTGAPYSTTTEASDNLHYIQMLGTYGDGGRWKMEMLDNSMTEAGKELVDSGVFFIVASGNSNQTQVNPDDPNYDNFISTGSNNNLYDDQYGYGGFRFAGTINRRGFPQHIGKTESQTFQGNTTVKFPAINIGALDDNLLSSKEAKVSYSDMGNAIDLYFPADGTLAATVGDNGTDQDRFDNFHTGQNLPVGTTFNYGRYNATEDARDARFSGTSSACPVAAGFLATIIQYNRGWTYEDLRSWIQTSVEVQDSADFHDGARGTAPDDLNWLLGYQRLQGGVARVGYLATYPVTTPFPTNAATFSLTGPATISENSGISNGYQVDTTNFNGQLYWSIDGTTNDFVETSGSVTMQQGADLGTFSITAIADSLTETDESFTISVRTGSVTGTVVDTLAITVSDTSLSTPTYALGGPSTITESGLNNVYTANATSLPTRTLYWSIDGTTDDFVETSGSIVITGSSSSSSGTFNLVAIADSVTETDEPYTISLRTGSVTGTVVDTLAITVSDTSTTPAVSVTYNLTGPATITEDVNAINNYIVTTTGVTGTIYWSINGTTDDFVATSGSIIISLNEGTFNLVAIGDSLTETDESYTISIRTGSVTGPVVDTLAITVSDTSTTPPATPQEPAPDPSAQIDTGNIDNRLYIYANFDTTAVIDPEREYYNLPRNTLPVLNQITASTNLDIKENAPFGRPDIGKLEFSTTGIDGYGYHDETFNFDTNYFSNQIIYFTVRVKTATDYPAKYVNLLHLGDGVFDDDSIKIDLIDSSNNTLAATISSDFGVLSTSDGGSIKGGFFKGAFSYNGLGTNLKLTARATSDGRPLTGESNEFNIASYVNTKEFRKLNEDNNQKQNFLDYLYQPNLKNNPNFFTDIVGQIVGDETNPNTLGVKVYEKISNFLLNSNDIDYANIDNLISNLKLIDSSVNKFSDAYPSSLKRIVDFFSVNRSKILPIKNNFNQDFNTKGRPSIGLGKNLGTEIKLSDTLSGGDNFKPIVALEKFGERYITLNTDPTSSFDFRYLGDNRTFQLSSYNSNWGWGLVLPEEVGNFTYMLDITGNNLVLEDGFRILNESGVSSEEMLKYYTFYSYISTTNDSNLFSFYDDSNVNSTSDFTTLSAINNSIDEIVLKDIYTGTNII